MITLLTVAGLLSAASLPADAGWNSYSNPRFAFRGCYPASLKPGRASDNGDGQVFNGANGAELRLWGQNDALGETPAQMARQEAGRLSKVSYQRAAKDWFVVSGTAKGNIVYRKSIVAGDRILSLQFRYPAADKAKWDALVGRMSACLKALPQ